MTLSGGDGVSPYRGTMEGYLYQRRKRVFLSRRDGRYPYHVGEWKSVLTKIDGGVLLTCGRRSISLVNE